MQVLKFFKQRVIFTFFVIFIFPFIELLFDLEGIKKNTWGRGGGFSPVGVRAPAWGGWDGVRGTDWGEAGGGALGLHGIAVAIAVVETLVAVAAAVAAVDVAVVYSRAGDSS